jgi:hypothetical protein
MFSRLPSGRCLGKRSQGHIQQVAISVDVHRLERLRFGGPCHKVNCKASSTFRLTDWLFGPLEKSWLFYKKADLCG